MYAAVRQPEKGTVCKGRRMNLKHNNKGLTLIEVMIASLIILILFLALMQSVLLSINMNNKNELRDVAVSIAEERMRELKSLDFDSADLADTGGVSADDGTATRTFRNFTRDFTRTRTIANLGGNMKSITLTVSYANIKDNTCSGSPDMACDTDGDCDMGQICGTTHTVRSILRQGG